VSFSGIITIPLQIAPTGKARPRVTKRGTFMPREYKQWISAVRFMARPYAIRHGITEPLRCSLSMAVEFSAPSGDLRCDGDNGIGAIMDALQVPPKGGWGLFVNDRQIKAGSWRIVTGPTLIIVMVEEIL
jgi:Holliday junction resolvase RusA-like endonuclease